MELVKEHLVSTHTRQTILRYEKLRVKEKRFKEQQEARVKQFFESIEEQKREEERIFAIQQMMELYDVSDDELYRYEGVWQPE